MRFYLIFTLCCLFLASCTKKDHASSTLRLNFLTEVNSLDPRFGYEIPANHAVKMLFEGLMRNHSSGELICAACERYEVSADQKRYTFYLRPAKWSNGDPVTAYDFAYAWKSVIDPKVPTQGAADFYPIKNVQAAVKRELPVDSVGVTVQDEQTLVVDLEYPAPYFLSLTATSVYSPVHSILAKANQEIYAISNGPFKLKEWRPHDQMIFEKNPLYWNSDIVKIDRIEISIIEDVMTQLALFERGEVDWLGKPLTKLPLDAVPMLRENQLLQTFPERAVYWYFLNTKEFPFNNQKLRKAFALAMNRQDIVSHVCKEDERVATSVNPGFAFKDHAIEEARELFEEALTELELTRDAFPTIPLSYCGIEINQKIACVIQQQWQEAFGIVVQLDPQEWTTYYDRLSSGQFLVGGLSWHARITDPIYNLQLFKYADDRLNMSNWEDLDFQALITKAEHETDQELRESYLKQAEELLIDQSPVIPVYFLSVSYAKNPKLEGVFVSDINEIDFVFAQK